MSMSLPRLAHGWALQLLAAATGVGLSVAAAALVLSCSFAPEAD